MSKHLNENFFENFFNDSEFQKVGYIEMLGKKLNYHFNCPWKLHTFYILRIFQGFFHPAGTFFPFHTFKAYPGLEFFPFESNIYHEEILTCGFETQILHLLPRISIWINFFGRIFLGFLYLLQSTTLSLPWEIAHAYLQNPWKS